MEPPSPTPTPPNQPIPPGTAGPARGAAVGAVPRRYPKPPPFMRHFIMLILRPESWAEAARYPTSATILPLMLAILVGAIAVSVGDTTRFIGSVRSNATQYDAHGYPPLTLHSNGTLSIEKPLAEPIRAELRGVPMPESTFVLHVDPTGATSPDSIKEHGFLLTDKEIIPTGEGATKVRTKLASVLPLFGGSLPAGQSVTINSQKLLAMADESMPIFIAFSVAMVVAHSILQSIWSIFMIFVFSPLVVLVAAGFRGAEESPQRRLLLPRRAAFRIMAGLLVPIVLVDSLLRAADYGLSRAVGMEWTLFVWLFICGALAIWAGLMARKMYQPREHPRRAS